MPSAIQEILRTGRDPNDSYEVTARYAHDWAGARFYRTLFDKTRNVVELQPTSLIFGPANWLPLGPATDALGNAYRADREKHLLLRKLYCEDVFKPLECLGGHGWQTGQFDHPAGVTIGCRGWLLVADAGNHRVQIIKPENHSVIAVLGKADHWGRYVAGTSGGAMVEPVQAICDPVTFRIYVADRAGGLIHVFDDRFEYECSFVPQTIPASGGLPCMRAPVAVSVADDGSLWVLGAHYARIMRMTTDGEPLDDIGLAAGQANPFAGGRALYPRYEVSGEVIAGPLDSGVFNQAWHKLFIEAEIPDGTSARLQSYASNSDVVDLDSVAWAPAAPVPLRSAEAVASDKSERLILSDRQVWERHRHGDYLRAQSPVHTFEGDGPSSSNTFDLTHDTARVLHVGDVVTLDTGAVSARLTIAVVSASGLRAYANGFAILYTAGTETWLIERNGSRMPGGSRLLHTLATGESVDLSAAVMNDRLTDVTLPHSVGALARIGDRLQLRQGNSAASLEVETLDGGQTVTITTDVIAAGDYSSSTLNLQVTTGRLVCADLGGFDVQPPRNLKITVDSADIASVGLLESDVNTLWLDPGSNVDFAAWQRFATEVPVTTDRGRYLWVRLDLRGALRHAGDEVAIATPVVHSVSGLTPRPSYLKMLPALYSRADTSKDPVGALFLERFLAIFEGRFTAMESTYEQLSALLNIESTDEEWLKFLSTWMGLVLDPSWSAKRRRQLLLELMTLYQKRGTCAGLSRYLEIYTGNKPVILEGFQWRPSTSMVVGRVGRLGCSMLKADSCDYEQYAHRFGIHVFVEENAELDVVEAAIRSIIDSVRPAHVDYDLRIVLPQALVGCQSRVGIDMVLNDQPYNPICLSATSDQPDEVQPHSVIGRDHLARNPSGSSRAGGPVLDIGGIQTRGLTLN